MFAAVSVGGQAQYQQNRLPFGHELADGGKPGIGRVGLNDGEGVRKPDRQKTRGHAGALQAQVEGQHRAVGMLRVQACPASSDRLAKSMPSSFLAAGRRSSGARSKITCGSAAADGPAFCLLSTSNWPAAPPA